MKRTTVVVVKFVISERKSMNALVKLGLYYEKTKLLARKVSQYEALE